MPDAAALQMRENDMWEYLIIAVVVLTAAFFTGRYLWRETKEGQCAHCNCASKNGDWKELVQIDIPDKSTK